MPADEVTHGTDVDASRVRTGPRHAAPKKPLFTRLHVPTGKAMALAAMPTAVLMGMGFTASMAIADNNSTPSPSKTLSADEYEKCVAALADGASASASPSPSASASESADDKSDGKTDEKPDGGDGKTDDTGSEPKPSETGGSSGGDSSSDSGTDSGSDAGSGDKADPTPTPSASADKEAESSGSDAGTPSPSASESGGGLLDTIGDTLEDVFTGGKKDTSDASPTPSPSASSTPAAGGDSADAGDSKDSGASDPVKETTDKVTDTVKDTVEGTTDKASEAAKNAEEAAKDAAKDAADAATATPSPSASSTPDADDCPVATDDEGGIDNKMRLPDDPWTLNASSLLLKGADYQGIVKVKTANGTVKEVLKYVISDGTDIGDLHQSVKDPHSGKTYHVQAGKGTTSTIRDGATVMYTEKISGNLFGLIPVTFSPDSPPPLNIPLIYFTNATVQQAGQFGGTLHVPGLHQYATG
ncbi:hypothetical protein [Streptomyces griseus]|uniref:hypothetical protein n=1 Tax=Streptomyces griseus TaxID=1911 RepID=UPI00055DD326|nr:hypothetical protein [Streptomyces griseus]